MPDDEGEGGEVAGGWEGGGENGEEGEGCEEVTHRDGFELYGFGKSGLDCRDAVMEFWGDGDDDES